MFRKITSSYVRSLMVIFLLLSGNAQANLLFSSNLAEIYSIMTEGENINAHPVLRVDKRALGQLFASIQINSDANGEVIYLMSELDAARLAEHVALSLMRLRPNQDMHLVIYHSVGGFLTTKRFSTGIRLFANDVGLNLIFGQLDTFQNEFRGPGRKLAHPGSRSNTQINGGSLVAADWFKFHTGRKDWMIYPIATTPSLKLRIKPGQPRTNY
ncbi:MAG: hypothetical protein KZQ92_05810 [Candidatus Thiodiazotropha sp. (ex Lucinoma borealis)]|nr:hypothetical protein [Candidatus Thiodiazotropha sp. (ex Lucinoma borealis)]